MRALASATMHGGKQLDCKPNYHSGGKGYQLGRWVRSREDWLELGEMEWKMGCGKMARQVSEQLAQKRLCGQGEPTWQEGQ